VTQDSGTEVSSEVNKTSFQLASLDVSGTMVIWTVVELAHGDLAGSEADHGLGLGGRVTLIRSAMVPVPVPGSSAVVVGATPAAASSVKAVAAPATPTKAVGAAARGRVAAQAKAKASSLVLADTTGGLLAVGTYSILHKPSFLMCDRYDFFGLVATQVCHVQESHHRLCLYHLCVCVCVCVCVCHHPFCCCCICWRRNV
jgi:hypothetical protein